MEGDAILCFTIPGAAYPDRHAVMTVSHTARPGQERSYVLTRTDELKLDIFAAEVMVNGR